MEKLGFEYNLWVTPLCITKLSDWQYKLKTHLKGGKTMETNIDIYGRILDLFDTIDAAIQHIEGTCGVNFEMAVTLLKDIRDATLEIKNSSDVLLKRLKQDIPEINARYEAVTRDLQNVLQAYENDDTEFIAEMIRKTVVPQLHLLRRNIVEKIGSNIAS